MTVTLKGTLQVPAHRIAEIREALGDHIRLTRAEDGCIQFEVTEDPNTAGLFYVQETFTDAAAFHHHQDRVAASAWGQISAGLPRDYQIEGLT